jgi:16S rRNA (guanine527-N7)-methyltransferase
MDSADRSSLPRRASPPTRAALPTDVGATAALDPIFSEVLERGLSAAGITLDLDARAAIEAHARLLIAWNEHVNLSGLRTPEQLARGQFLDSLIAVPTLRSLDAAPALIDLGSGGGFPGLPLAVALPARRAALVDSIGKKAAFLRAAAAAQDEVEINVLAERAEDLDDDPEQREAWDIVTARAIGAVTEVAELGLPLAKVGGHVVSWKSAGEQLTEELRNAGELIGIVGGGKSRIVELVAASEVGLSGHCLVVIDKIRPTPDGYPRQPGERRRRPLG